MDSILNMRFGRLVVQSETKVRKGKCWATSYVCKCDCGEPMLAFKYDLTKGKTTSCGCSNRERLKKGKALTVDLTGQRFGRLTVTRKLDLRLSGTQGARRQFWGCVCDCGTSVEIDTSSLNTGNTRSCGCYTQDVNRTANVFSMVNRVRRAALKANHAWHLSDDEAAKLLAMNCEYCGSAPRVDTNYTHLTRNGIDRVDSSKEYSLDNVVACCKICNHMKRDMSVDAFKEHIVKIHNKLKGI